MGGADQWGNITAGPRAHPAHQRRRRREPRPRHRVQAAAVAVGREVRQERGRRLRVARPGADDAVRVLPVLGPGGRPRRRARTCAGSRSSRASGSRRSTPRSPPIPSSARRSGSSRSTSRRASTARPRPRTRCRVSRGAVPARADHRPRAAGRRPCATRGPDVSPPSATAWRSLLASTSASAPYLERRGPAADARAAAFYGERRCGSRTRRRRCPSRSAASGSRSGSASGKRAVVRLRRAG